MAEEMQGLFVVDDERGEDILQYRQRREDVRDLE